MESLKQAYEVLGLSEDATKEELEHRYYLLMRRLRAQKMREASEIPDGERLDEDAITRAYRFILDYEKEQESQAYIEQHYGKNKAKAERKLKREHFFQYYKFHILGAILVLALIGYGINSYIDHREEQRRLASLPPASLSVMFFGEYFYGEGFGSDTEPLAEDIVALFPDWQRVIAGLTYVPSEIRSEQDMALIQKSMITMIDDKSDLFILDRDNFSKLAKQEAFLPLEEAAGEAIRPLLDTDAAVAETLEPGLNEEDEQPEEHVYGIDLSDTPIGETLGITGNEFIAAIRATAEHQQNAEAFIAYFARVKG